MSSLHILHFNDVYHVIPKGDIHPLLQFYTVLRSHRKADHTIQLFSGDAFGGSRLSTMTEGQAMLDVLKELKPDACVIGNHELDHGYERMALLLRESSMAGLPWLLSNVKGKLDDMFPSEAPYQQHLVIERPGIRIGVIGLMDLDCYDCSQTQWLRAKYDSNDPEAVGLLLDDITRVGLECSEYLRKEKKCDIVIALTHASLTGDFELARALKALSPCAQDAMNESAKGSTTMLSFSKTPGVDLILGGHDHFYFVSKGIQSWVNRHGTSGRENEGDDVLIVKSGTNFYDLSELNLILEDSTDEGSVRRKVIRGISGEHFDTKVQEPDAEVAELMKKITDQAPTGEEELVGYFDKKFDTTESALRTSESAVGNWVGNVIRPFYDSYPGIGRTDGVIIGAGSIRDWPSDANAPRSLGDMMELLPFPGEAVVLLLNGADIWTALNHALSKYPDAAGRFPVISGFRITWDSDIKRRDALNRVTGVWLLSDQEMDDMTTNPVKSKEDKRGTWIPNNFEGRTYKVVTLWYIVKGGDGYGDILKEDPVTGRRKLIVKKEAGHRLDDIMIKFLKDGLMSMDHIYSVEWDPKTKTVSREFTSGLGHASDHLPSLLDVIAPLGGPLLFPAWALATLLIKSNQSIGEWAQLNPGPKPIPLYLLYNDGRLLDEARVAEQ